MSVVESYLPELPVETLEQIMFYMDPETIINFCNDNTFVKPICNDNFWRKKYQIDFVDENIPPEIRAKTPELQYRQRLNYNPKNPWNIKRAARAVDGHFFISKIGEILSPLSIERKMQQNPDLIYHTGYRIVGTPSEVIQMLRNAGIYEDTINDILATAITSENYNQEPYKSMIADDIQKYKEIQLEQSEHSKNRWTREKAQDAANKNLFINMVDGSLIELNPKNLIDYPRRIYSIDYRVAGPRSAVTKYLREAGFSHGDIKNILSNAIDGYNYTEEPFATLYQQELERKNTR